MDGVWIGELGDRNHDGGRRRFDYPVQGDNPMICEDHPVKPDDVRPARQDGTCFYCRVPLGKQHNVGCVLRYKTIVVEVTMRLVRRVPEDWDANMIEFHMNDSSWCASNFIGEIQSVNTKERCLCDRTEGKFVREATKEDEERYGICDAE